MNQYLDFAQELAFKTGGLLKKYFLSSGLKKHKKSDHSITTDADMAADQMIAYAIYKRFPHDLLMSEELQPAYPEFLQAEDRAIWIADPLDGTTNFNLGFHIWGVLLTRLVDGRPNTAVLYFPLLDECYYAQHGHGAYLNGNRIHVKQTKGDRSQSFFICCSRTLRQYQVNIPDKYRILGSAAYTFCSLARGIASLGFEAHPKIWDIAGGWLLVNEAGGVTETFDDSKPFPLSPGINYAQKSFPTLIAASREIANEARLQILSKG